MLYLYYDYYTLLHTDITIVNIGSDIHYFFSQYFSYHIPSQFSPDSLVPAQVPKRRARRQADLRRIISDVGAIGELCDSWALKCLKVIGSNLNLV